MWRVCGCALTRVCVCARVRCTQALPVWRNDTTRFNLEAFLFTTIKQSKYLHEDLAYARAQLCICVRL